MATDSPGGGSRRPKPILRARFIPDRLVVEIADIVRHWPELPLSWELIRQQIVHDLLNREARRTKHLPKAWSRQALSKNATIKKAYKERKDELTRAQARDATRPKRRRDPVVVVLKQENETLKIKIKQLEDTVRFYEDRHRTMLANGGRGEVDPLKPLPEKIDRRPKDE